MRTALTYATLSAFLLCSEAAFSQSQDKAPVPTPLPNVPSQEPAFEGQTRAPQIDSNVTLDHMVVADGFEHPWAIEFMPDGRMLVTERAGRLRIVSPSGEVSDPVKGLPRFDTRGQGGLLDVVLGRDFANDRKIYFSYAEPHENGKTNTAVARATLAKDGSTLNDVEVIFQQQPSWDSTKHYGSRLVWDNNGHLYVTLGERALPESRQLAQQLDNHLGKVMRINPDGSAPENNPFVDKNNAKPEIWSYGHRNIQGAALNPGSGALWTIEHGPQGGDEINIPEAGKNYGWPVITYGEDYSGEPIGEGITAKQGMEQPIYYWDPVISPSGVAFYQGNMFPNWQGNLLISALHPSALVRLELDGNRVKGEERLLTDVGRIRDVAEGPDGAVWVITDKDNGELIHVTRGD
ncbi:PQQ-dependent sugar dehydrogenase [Phytohalomonas tamaricis]|uniref:PQQ-dependent sugar dehydrogenase n=1 Tax=Phytohalomonas tamaricis TaxID=2081032 RepID=UPI000D0AC1D1|nr:PQQ-dependent sugar dehydrogenase [Phytohalomonas tamaricis]